MGKKESELEKKAKEVPKLPDFDPDFSPSNPCNREAAKARGLSYNPRRKVYIDEDGFSILDKYGQPLG